MTVEERAKVMLTDSGLWPDEVQAVIDAEKADKTSEAMKGRWHDDADGYPSQLFTVLWIGLRHTAAEWLKVNKPEHWARPMFDDSF